MGELKNREHLCVFKQFAFSVLLHAIVPDRYTEKSPIDHLAELFSGKAI